MTDPDARTAPLYPPRQDAREGLVLVQFKGNRRELFRNPYELPFQPGDLALVEAERGQDAGWVRHRLDAVVAVGGDRPRWAVLRRALPADHERYQRLRDQEPRALQICRERAAARHLNMDLVDAEYRFDGLKLTFYFSAEGRVDFRELVRDLAAVFKTRIELRQIGARDIVKRLDGMGSCGQQLCCVRFLDKFKPITTQMAKHQNLILNPAKLSGPCGRLKCCLAYEYEQYAGKPEAVLLDATDESLDPLSD